MATKFPVDPRILSHAEYEEIRAKLQEAGNLLPSELEEIVTKLLAYSDLLIERYQVIRNCSADWAEQDLAAAYNYRHFGQSS